ncbi:MAG TPA: bifunctional 4-hydroxy-2-oxoglutarate aldolase/2-dehydro-3-deoxy-phosphogluconate aldolase [Rectinemataceae bacterium]|nr:bifunctional 4-hydroxy-2-oxoglutarate aldolase/2-dehydro-3-deoxy-phosphogluconate aldolase [Rectinemataceae bacterium]
MQEIFAALRARGIVPVIKLEKAETALPLAAALIEGGLPVAEITFRTAAAAEAISLIRRNHPSILLGAGTLTTPEQVEAAIEAGASYAVSPGFNPRIVELCQKRGLPIIPGVNNPSQVEQGLERGLDLLKFFPAEASGGVKMLKALHGPYAEVSFVPTGGVELSNLESYLGLPYVAAIGGTWMVKEDLIAGGRFKEIAELCRAAVDLAAAIRKN